jgi:hypothetical protein
VIVEIKNQNPLSTMMNLTAVLHGLLLAFLLSRVSSFSISPKLGSRKSQMYMRTNKIEYQSDCGRGEQHLSASLVEGNMVVFQEGTWLVDGVEVGDGTEPSFRYALIETMQLVWTHNCEHGVLRGLEVDIVSDDSRAKLVEPMAELEFGPEQLVAHIPVDWDENSSSGRLLIPVQDDMWLPME